MSTRTRTAVTDTKELLFSEFDFTGGSRGVRGFPSGPPPPPPLSCCPKNKMGSQLHEHNKLEHNKL